VLALQGNATLNLLTSSMFNVADMRESSVKISEAILKQPMEHPVILVGHNGPAGLGSEKHDICGKDFVPEAGTQ
jgi:uncharacterized protein (TIGR04168 family)